MGGDCKTLAEQAHLSLSLFQRHRPMGGDCKQMTRPSMLLANGVSAPSPHGRGLQVDICRTMSHNGYCFSAITPWEGTASGLVAEGHFRIAAFQRHRPMGGDCKWGASGRE